MGLENLPKWATEKADAAGKVKTVVCVDSVAAYSEWLDLLKVAKADVDQYWLEVAYQCAKLDVQAALAGTDCDPRTCGMPTGILFSNAPEFALAQFPEGKGVARATQGKEARNHYVRVRGRMPL